ncbi:MAG: hypothetical protein ABL879_01130 [Devosia sp.]
MGKRSGIPDTDEAADALPIGQVEADLANVQRQLRIPRQDLYLKKSLEKRAIWLTKYLERRKASGK